MLEREFPPEEVVDTVLWVDEVLFTLFFHFRFQRAEMDSWWAPFLPSPSPTKYGGGIVTD